MGSVAYGQVTVIHVLVTSPLVWCNILSVALEDSLEIAACGKCNHVGVLIDSAM